MAIWSRKWYIVIPLVAVILGHWSLLLHGMQMSDPSWNETNSFTRYTIDRCIRSSTATMCDFEDRQHDSRRNIHLYHVIRLPYPSSDWE